MLERLPFIALAGSSLLVLPFVGDTIREPKWLWLWACAALAVFFFLQGRAWPRLPFGAWAVLAYALIQPYFFSPVAVVWPFTLGLLSLVLLSLVPVGLKGERILLAAVWLQGALGTFQRFGWDPIFFRFPEAEAHLPVGFIGQATLFGAWMAAMAWYWAGHRRWVTFLFCSACAFATESAFTGFAWLAGMGACLLWRSRWAGITYFSLLGGGAALAVSSGAVYFWDNGRYLAWKMILAAWSRRPWFGYGLDSFHREFPFLQGFSGPRWHQAHSEPLELLFGGGIVGWILALWMLGHLWLRRKQWWGREECLPWFLALVAVFANSIGNFPLHIAPTALLFAMAYFRLISRVAV